MTMEETGEVISEADVTAFGRKLAAWAEDLSPRERAILTETVARAAAVEGQDVRGFDTGTRPTGLSFSLAGFLDVLFSSDSDRDRHRPPR